ncbi:HD domain-containing protein [Comamonadaceae bacterium G21597-S1]|nr:HD domain-containing protein [Comamonadaceae bacterium G21597-S1]
MHTGNFENHLTFIREAQRLKDVLRSGHTAQGRRESTAEHSWRLCLMVLVFARELPGIDLLRLLKICIIHDLGEAIGGDIPAIEQDGSPDKALREREDLLTLLAPLPPALQQDFLDLWDEYDAAATPEARAAKALDKLETLIQHNQGANPPDFDYRFNLTYGQKYTDADPLFAALRALVDADTRRRVEGGDGGR